MKKKQGFTLIELLVVISIIAVLMSIVLVSLSGARKNKGYVKRLSDIGQIDNAITAYQIYSGKYPNTNNVWFSYGTCAVLGSTATSTYVPNVRISLPRDPSAGTNCATSPMYAYKSNGREYKIIAINVQEDKGYVLKKNPERVDPVRPATSTTPAFGFWSPGGAAW